MKHILLTTFALIIWISETSPQNHEVMKDRKPAVAGTFYPATNTALKHQMIILFENIPETTENDVAALIVPHAGYVFSGEVAASAYAKINRQARYKNIFIIGRSHRKFFDGVSIYPKGNYITPLGEVKINDKTTSQLIEKHSFIYYDEEADRTEHSLEVQLPFLQYWLYNDFQIVPLIIGSDDPGIYEKLAEALMPWFNADNLFVISTDFSHYPTYETAVKTDAETADAIVANDSEKLKECCNRNSRFSGKNLQTGLCGAAAVQTLLHLTQNNPDITFKKITYKNSGDVPEGDKNRVVGYWAIAVMRNKTEISISAEDKLAMLKLARESITRYLIYPKSEVLKPISSAIMNEHFGAFVTLKKEGKLRGCIGRFEPSTSLYQTITEMAIAAATRDSRFDPVTIKEISQIKIEISILTPLKKINSIDEIEPGKHGIYIKKGLNSGTFLPQVATETGWTKEEFLGHCARDKAGIGWEGWKTAELYTYEAIVFGEE
ncbi:MAG: AmmeMemoRadiSam system protein B [Mariniphaga sp.]|nr:AmmeMemoRadiSam system protein B [Mariniphaga sp.]